jgi:predicted  nucleic acid-binding Zn-ribbon protein
MSENNTQEILEIPVEQRLKSLYELQKVMSKIDEIKILRGDLPLEVQDLEDEIAGLNTRIQRINTDITEKEQKISDAKNSIEEIKIKITRKTEQQGQVVNNREYEILSKELENLDLDIQLHEKNITDSTNFINFKQEDLEKSQDESAEKKNDLKLKKAELNQIIIETKQEEETLREQSKQLETQIDARLLSAFKRIRKNARNGLAVVAVERNSCSGCFSKIPPQRQLDIRLRKKIIVCENCGRILIDHDMTKE